MINRGCFFIVVFIVVATAGAGATVLNIIHFGGAMYCIPRIDINSIKTHMKNTHYFRL